MIPARPHAGFSAAFAAYLRWLLRRSFDAVWVRNDARLPRGGFIAAPNHGSWWDGFVPFVVQRSIAPDTPFLLMMSEIELRRFPFFAWAGAFSVDGSSPRAAHPSFRYAALHAARGAGVWIFPEGELRPGDAEPRFSSGFVHAARSAGVPIVPVAMRYVLLRGQRPEAFVATAPAIDPSRSDACAAAERDVARLLAEIDETLRAGNPVEGFRALLRSSGGVDRTVARVVAWGRHA